MERLVYYYKQLPVNVRWVLLALFGIYVAFSAWESQVIASLDKLSKSQEDVTKFDEQILALATTAKSSVTIRNEMQKTKEEITAVFENLPSDFDIEQILAAFAVHAKSTAVEIKKFVPNKEEALKALESPDAPPTVAQAEAKAKAAAAKPGDPKSEQLDYARKKTLSVEIIGQYKDIVNFLDHILGMPRVILLESFDLKRQTSGNATTGATGPAAVVAPVSLLSASLVLSTFSQKQEALEKLFETSSTPAAAPDSQPKAKASAGPAPTPAQTSLLENQFLNPIMLQAAQPQENFQKSNPMSDIYRAASLILKHLSEIKNPQFLPIQEGETLSESEVKTLKEWLQYAPKQMTSGENPDKSQDLSLRETKNE